MRTIVWFRDGDLRLADHAALRESARSGEVIPLFVLEPDRLTPAAARRSPNRTQFVLDALRALEADLSRRGSRLIVVAGESSEVVPRLASQWRADRVAAQSSVEPERRERDQRVQRELGDRLMLHAGATLASPGTLRTAAGEPYGLFAQFARSFRLRGAIDRPGPTPRRLPALPKEVAPRVSDIPTCESLRIARNPALLGAGERAARQRLRSFLRDALADYPTNRDRMDLAATSRLSADLRAGTISVRQVWTAVQEAPAPRRARERFLSELLWREFAYDILWNRPWVLERPYKPEFAGFPWRYEEAHWQAWALGRTGYPVVDASARQLLGEGFVHNRARMISASFLTKHLLIDYRRGEAHYLTHLADADPANNNYGWQWSVGCGCDAQPYFRVFNPVLQGEKFDPEGGYVRRWVPELARLPAAYIHRPWEAPDETLREAGIRLGTDYPRPVVDHRFARQRFLDVAAEHLARSS